MRAAFATGLKLHEYNDMTPRELNIHIEEYYKRQTYEHKERIVASYMGAYFQRVKRMPTLEKVLGEQPKKKQPMSDEQMLNVIKILNRKIGGKEVGA